MEDEIKIRIDGIDVISKALYNFRLSDNDVFNHQITTQALADVGKKLIIVFVQIKIHKINEPDKLLGELTTAIGFVIENFEDVFHKNDEGKFIIPNDIENFVKTLSISTTRGILYSEFKGTILHKAILPIIMLDTLQPREGLSLFEEINNK